MLLPVAFLSLFACSRGGPTESRPPPPDSQPIVDDTHDTTTPPPTVVSVKVTLDGDPVEGALVSQGGVEDEHWTTDPAGEVATLTLHPDEVEPFVLIAAHPDARTEAVFVENGVTDYEIALLRFDTADNPDYTFLHPGTPDINQSTAYCSHCHVTINEDWYSSPHSRSASNPVVHDVYAGVAAALSEQTTCEDAGGTWWTGIEPGTGKPTDRCYVGAGTLPDLNDDCGDSSPCDGIAKHTGACADCHAPGIDGELGGRDLLEATGISHDYGVHCDVCHKVASVDLDAPPGVGGRLEIVRPTEDSTVAGEAWEPLTFGPYPDVPNPKMGAVYRALHREASFCAGCHEYDQPALVPKTQLDAERWPDGTLPVHSTYSEWLAGPLADRAPCQSCHMPPDPDAGNTADIQLLSIGEGVSAGWWREPGNTRRHIWSGPRQDGGEMLRLAASLAIEAQVTKDETTVLVTTKNAGAGHAIPTGEPMRSLVLLVEATCEGSPLQAIGGDVVPDFGGYVERKVGGDWTQWEAAEVGMQVRVVARTGGFHDYAGVAPFDGWPAEERGMPIEEPAGTVTITAIDGGIASFDGPLPEGDVAYLVEASGWPVDGTPAVQAAGLPGFGFARVLVDADGARMVPHHRAIDIASDNRLMPQASWVSTHRFEACEAPQVRAILTHRAYPHRLARQRSWTLDDSVMVEESR